MLVMQVLLLCLMLVGVVTVKTKIVDERSRSSMSDLVLCAIRSELLKSCFMNWVRDIKQDIKREVIAIDGKTVRGMATKSRFKAGTEAKAIHLVSAWATENQLVFAQVQTDEKSNEITAIPALLEQVAIAGCVVTIDAAD
jgi:hypothetical protein